MLGQQQAQSYQQAAGSSTLRENTMIEAHRDAMIDLEQRLGECATRAMRMADRLLGNEPSPTVGAQNKPTTAAEPPLMTQLSEGMVRMAQMAESIQYHLNRLERL